MYKVILSIFSTRVKLAGLIKCQFIKILMMIPYLPLNPSACLIDEHIPQFYRTQECKVKICFTNIQCQYCRHTI